MLRKDCKVLNSSFKAPHQHSSSTALRCIEELMRLTHDHPDLMENLVYLGGATSLALIAAPWLLPVIGGIELSGASAAGLSAIGAVLGAGSFISAYAQHNILGFPDKDEEVYHDSQFHYKEASAELITGKTQFPLLKIKSKNHYDAGYVEGYILGNAIETSLNKLESLYNMFRKVIGTPESHEADKLRKCLSEILQTIPENYREEMQGKVAGYNTWLKAHKPGALPLTFEFYLLMQLQPDIHNYNPLPIHWLGLEFGCTSTVFRLGDYTVFTRILDWPSFSMANHFLQIERSIQGSKTTTDIGFPLVTGLLTAVNEDGLLVEINVAHGESVSKPQGMPALFFNRYCAEHATTVADIHKILEQKQPLSAYHMTATNGSITNSFHFYQSMNQKGKHVIDVLGDSKLLPEFMVVANPSVKIKNDKVCVYNFKDSKERQENVKAFFDQTKLQPYISKQTEQKSLSSDDIKELEELALQMARVDIVNNCASTLCALYVYHKDKLIDARAVTDNNFAPDKPLCAFKALSI